MAEESVGRTVHRAARLMRKLADRKLVSLGLSSGHLPILTALMGCEGLSQKALAKQAEIEQPTMAATLGRMERDGIIARVPDPDDRRSFLYSLTPETQTKVPEIRLIIESMNEAALSGFAAERRADFRTMLAELVVALERTVK